MCLFVLSDIFLFVLLILSLLLPVITSSDELGSVLFLFCFSIGLFLVCLNAVFFVIGTVIVKRFFQHRRITRDGCFFWGRSNIVFVYLFLAFMGMGGIKRCLCVRRRGGRQRCKRRK